MMYETNATVPSPDMVVSGGPVIPGSARILVDIAAIASLVACWSAWVTTTSRASVVPSGHFSVSRLTAWTPSIESGNEAKSDWPMWSRSAGTAIARSSADAATK